MRVHPGLTDHGRPSSGLGCNMECGRSVECDWLNPKDVGGKQFGLQSTLYAYALRDVNDKIHRRGLPYASVARCCLVKSLVSLARTAVRGLS